MYDLNGSAAFRLDLVKILFTVKSVMNELVFSIFQAETFLSYIEEMRFLYVLREKSAYEDFKIVL